MNYGITNHMSKLTVLSLLVVLASCSQPKKESNTIDSIIPKPQTVTPSEKKFLLGESTSIIADTSAEVKSVANYLASKLKPATGFNLPPSNDQAAKGTIIITTSGADAQLGEEGYELTVTEDQVKLVAPNAAGLFRGVQTIRQLLPAAVESATLQKNAEWSLPTGTIRDFPNYKWRGVMLDVSRHFFSVEDVKRLIDEMAYYKLNV